MKKIVIIIFIIASIVMSISSYVYIGKINIILVFGIIACYISILLLRECMIKEKREKYIHKNGKEEHPLLYTEFIKIKNEYDIAKRGNKVIKILKIGFFIGFMLYIFAFLHGLATLGYISYTRPNEVIIISFIVIVILTIVYLIINVFALNIRDAFDEIEIKMYNLCLNSQDDEVAVEELKNYRYKIENDKLLTKKFKKIRKSQLE